MYGYIEGPAARTARSAGQEVTNRCIHKYVLNPGNPGFAVNRALRHQGSHTTASPEGPDNQGFDAGSGRKQRFPWGVGGLGHPELVCGPRSSAPQVLGSWHGKESGSSRWSVLCPIQCLAERNICQAQSTEQCKNVCKSAEIPNRLSNSHGIAMLPRTKHPASAMD